MAEAGWSDAKGLVEFLKDPVAGFNGLKQMINDPQMRQAMGDQAFAAMDQKIASMQTALTMGGDDAAIQLGKDLGGLIWQVGTIATGVGGAAKTGVILAKAGLVAGEAGLDTMRLAAKILKTDVKGLGGVVDMVDTGMQFGKGIVGQGKPFEAFVQSKLPLGTLDLNSIKTNFSTFDHLTPDGVTISTKTLDTAATTYQNPSKITGRLNGYVDDMVGFVQDGKKGGAFQLKDADIAVKQMQLGIPANASAVQLSAIAQSIQYAEGKSIQIVVTKVK